MSAKATDHWILPALLASLLVWLICLVVLSSAALDPSPVTTVLTAAALGLGVAVAARLPGKLARAVQWVLACRGRASLPDVGFEEAGALDDSDERRARSRLPVVGAGVALVGCVGSSLLVYQAGHVAAWFLAHYLPSPWGWVAVKFVLMFVAMLPGALGLAVLLLTLVITRRHRGQQAFQHELRDLLAGAALASAVTAVAVWGGLNLLGVSLIAAVGVIACGVALVFRPVPPGPLQTASRPLEIPTAWQRLAVVLTFALGALGLATQWRVLADALGASLSGGLLWLAVSLAMLCWLGHRRDGRSRPPSRSRTAGCVIGVVCGLLLQVSLVGAGVGATGGGWVLWLLAASGQVPLAAMSATILSRVRRVFGASGGRPRMFLSLAGGGLACGAVGYLLLAASPWGALIALGVALSTVVGAVLLYIRRSEDPPQQIAWAVLGTGMTCLVTLAVLLGVRAMHRRVGRLQAGSWLTVSTPAGSAMPDRETFRSQAVEDALGEMLASARGRWVWARLHGPAPGDPNSLVAWRTWPADPTAIGRRGWDLPARLIVSRDHVDGVLYEPLPADHPSAWRAYCLTSMRRLGAISAGGTVLLRTQAGVDRAPAALAVAVTYRHALGDGWAVLDLRGGSVDLLIAGPIHRVARPADVEGAIVVKLSTLVDALGPLRPIRVFRPGGWAWVSLDVDGLRRTLKLKASPRRSPLPF
ncbi:MAG: hypothetical protein ACLFVY_06270 [Phycisphaerae bacterium]